MNNKEHKIFQEWFDKQVKEGKFILAEQAKQTADKVNEDKKKDLN